MNAVTDLSTAQLSVADLMHSMGSQAKVASPLVAKAQAAIKNKALLALARLLREQTEALQVDNAQDLARARANGLSEPMVDRLKLTPKVIETVALGCEQLAAMGDIIGDLNSYANHVLSAKRLGIFTIGGGVPRNWAQQVGPYIEIGNLRLGLSVKPPRFHYGVRICPEPDYWGGLSGCTYQEGLSWGKFVTPKDGGQFAEVLSDATVVWPLLMMGLMERIQKQADGAGRS